MKRAFSALLLFVISNVGYAQDSIDDTITRLKAAVARMDDRVVPPAPVQASKSDYDIKFRQAVDRSVPLVVFVGGEPRNISGVVTCRNDAFPGVPFPCIVVSKPDGRGGLYQTAPSYSDLWHLPATASDGAVRSWAGLEVGQLALPFERLRAPLAAPDADADSRGPWLPKRDQDYVRSLWPDGVEFPKNLKFYKLKTASQAVAAFGTPGAGNNRRFVPPSMGLDNANREYPWVGSGGMDFAKPGTWRNVTGMALPENGKIKVWLGPMLVSTQYEIAMHWEFPTGTQMFDVLLRKNDDGSEHIFTVRRRVKRESGWDDGASFMPDVPYTVTATNEVNGSARVRRVLGIEVVKFRYAKLDPVEGRPKFKEFKTTLGMDDGGHFFPPGFMGTGMTCNACHNAGVHEAQVYGGPLLRGKDTIFSFFPIPESLVVDGERLESGLFERVHVPGVDRRWPIDFVTK